ncbi:hypothetical protein SHB62_000318 [Vibrio cholerae]|nr:hypothetical protein [Vibrio cholerae]
MKKIETSKTWKPLINKTIQTTILYPLTISICFSQPILYMDDAHTVNHVSLSSDDVRLMGTPKKSLPQPYKLKHALYLFDKNNYHIGTFMCEPQNESPVVSYWLPTDRNDNQWTSYSTYAEREINNCQNWYHVISSIQDLDQIKYWYVYIDDGKLYGGKSYGVSLNLIPFNPTPTPTHCDVNVTQNINFGIINILNNDEIINGTGVISTRCDRKTDLTISVNNGKDLDNKDGSRISFTYTNYHEAEKEIPISISVRANLESPPLKPGDYKWYVPIVINYK